MAYRAFSYRQDSAVPPFPDDKPIIVFDGYCALCSGWANFVLRHDRRGKFRLLTAQSPLGQALYAHYGLGGDDYQSNLLLQNGHVFIKSEGSILMACGLGWPWKSASPRMLVERFGPLRFQLELMPANDRLNWVLRGGRLWRLKLPRFLLPRGETYEYEADGRFHFHVELLHPLAGLVVRYRGWLKPTQPPSS